MSAEWNPLANSAFDKCFGYSYRDRKSVSSARTAAKLVYNDPTSQSTIKRTNTKRVSIAQASSVDITQDKSHLAHLSCKRRNVDFLVSI